MKSIFTAVLAAILLHAGADVNARARNKFDNTPLQVSMLTQSVRAAKALINAGADVNARELAYDVIKAGPGDFPVGLTVSMSDWSWASYFVW